MAQVRIAAVADRFHAPHTVAVVLAQADIALVDHIPEAGPAAEGIELGFLMRRVPARKPRSCTCQRLRRYIRTEHGDDGAVSVDGNVIGCYVHGLFWSDAFRKAWLNSLQQGAASDLHYQGAVDDALDELAKELESVLDIDALLADANWK